MRTLLLMRHGKSDRSEDKSDLERPLTKRGWDDASLIGRMLVEAKLIPGLVLTSPAVRAWTTAKLVAGAGGFPGEPVKVESLYGASAGNYLAVIHGQDDRLGTLLLIGHNPTLEDLLATLCGPCRCPLPTATVACLDTDLEHWSDLAPQSCHLRWLITPRLLRQILGQKG